MVETKTQWGSRKFWFNTISILLGALSLAIIEMRGTPEIIEQIGSKGAIALMIIGAGINWVLVTFYTKKPIEATWTTPKVPPPDITKSESRNISATEILYNEIQANDDFTKEF